MKKIVVTYNNADLDCVASAYAYAEYLNKINENAFYYIKGIVQDEVNIVSKIFGIKFDNKENEINNEDIIVVDTNTLSSVDYINPENIVEIIDHHLNSGDIQYCPNAILRLYEVGAVCTVIAEMFKDNNIDISRESAILLYYGIISNTVNLKSKITTEKDIEILSWLKSKCSEIDETIIEKIFKEKSYFDISDLRRHMEVEEKFVVQDTEMIIGQLEIVGAFDYLKENKESINNVINEVYRNFNIPFIFINIIDILNGYHLIYTPNNECATYLEGMLNCKFNNGVCKEDKIVLRKEIKKSLREASSNIS